jgi:hypothetical protein
MENTTENENKLMILANIHELL